MLGSGEGSFDGLLAGARLVVELGFEDRLGRLFVGMIDGGCDETIDGTILGVVFLESELGFDVKL